MLALALALMLAGFVLAYVGVRGLDIRHELLAVFGGGS